MYSRRGGIKYLVPGLKARKVIYREGLGSFSDFIFVSAVHSIISLLPNGIRGGFIKKVEKINNIQGENNEKNFITVVTSICFWSQTVFASDKLQESYFTENNKMGITLKHQKKQLI